MADPKDLLASALTVLFKPQFDEIYKTITDLDGRVKQISADVQLKANSADVLSKAVCNDLKSMPDALAKVGKSCKEMQTSIEHKANRDDTNSKFESLKKENATQVSEICKRYEEKSTKAMAALAKSLKDTLESVRNDMKTIQASTQNGESAQIEERIKQLDKKLDSTLEAQIPLVGVLTKMEKTVNNHEGLLSKMQETVALLASSKRPDGAVDAAPVMARAPPGLDDKDMISAPEADPTIDLTKCLPGCMNPAKGIHHKKCPNYKEKEAVPSVSGIICACGKIFVQENERFCNKCGATRPPHLGDAKGVAPNRGVSPAPKAAAKLARATSPTSAVTVAFRRGAMSPGPKAKPSNPVVRHASPARAKASALGRATSVTPLETVAEEPTASTTDATRSTDPGSLLEKNLSNVNSTAAVSDTKGANHQQKPETLDSKANQAPKVGKGSSAKLAQAEILDGTFQIHIKTLAGDAADFIVSASHTVAKFKLQIQDKLGIQPQQQTLVFAGRQVDDGRPADNSGRIGHCLGDFNIEKGSVVHLVMRQEDEAPPVPRWECQSCGEPNKGEREVCNGCGQTKAQSVLDSQSRQVASILSKPPAGAPPVPKPSEDDDDDDPPVSTHQAPPSSPPPAPFDSDALKVNDIVFACKTLCINGKVAVLSGIRGVIMDTGLPGTSDISGGRVSVQFDKREDNEACNVSLFPSALSRIDQVLAGGYKPGDAVMASKTLSIVDGKYAVLSGIFGTVCGPGITDPAGSLSVRFDEREDGETTANISVPPSMICGRNQVLAGGFKPGQAVMASRNMCMMQSDSVVVYGGVGGIVCGPGRTNPDERVSVRFQKREDNMGIECIDVVPSQICGADKAFSEGDNVEVIEAFSSNSSPACALAKGIKGMIKQIDTDGDAFIAFADIGSHWVVKKNFMKLRKLDEAFREGEGIEVAEDFEGNSVPSTQLSKGLKGVIKSIDKAGDAYIFFAALSGKDDETHQWVLKSNFSKLKRLNQVLKIDELVEVVETFPSNSKNPALLREGMRGVVMEIDPDGDSCIAFSEVGNQWVLRTNFTKLQRVEEGGAPAAPICTPSEASLAAPTPVPKAVPKAPVSKAVAPSPTTVAPSLAAPTVTPATTEGTPAEANAGWQNVAGKPAKGKKKHRRDS